MLSGVEAWQQKQTKYQQNHEYKISLAKHLAE